MADTIILSPAEVRGKKSMKVERENTRMIDGIVAANIPARNKTLPLYAGRINTGSIAGEVHIQVGAKTTIRKGNMASTLQQNASVAFAGIKSHIFS